MVADDPQSGVVKVVVFDGKPAADGKEPAEVFAAVQDPKTKSWLVQLPASTDKAGTLDVTVQLVNGAGQKTNKTVKVQLVDAKGGAGKKTGSTTVSTGTARNACRAMSNTPRAGEGSPREAR